MSEKPGHCIWKSDEDYYDEGPVWETSCGNSFEFFNDGPMENKFQFCPYCGQRLVEEGRT